MANTLRQRLLKDVAEIQTKPYPNIALRLHDDNDLTHACLVLTVESYGNMHLTVELPKDYPLNPPRVQMNSNISHPNIFGTYICSSILNTTEGYTSAYTLKGIAIQLLSFFSSDRVEQTGGGQFIDLSTYKAEQSNIRDTYTCSKCRFGTASFNIESLGDRTEARPQASPCATLSTSYEDLWPTPQESSQPASPSPSASFGLVSKQSGQSPILGRNARRRKAKQNAETRARTAAPGPLEPADSSLIAMDLDEPEEARYRRNLVDMKLPNEIILFICDQLETEDLMCFAQAWSRIPRLMAQFDMIRTRELQCFCLKESYLAVNLGVGVHIDLRTKSIESEFDLLSEVGFKAHKIRRSTQGRAFEHWLPLPISNGHWRKVAGSAWDAIENIALSLQMQQFAPVKVLYQFMNDIVVKLNQQASQRYHGTYGSDPYLRNGGESIESSLTHASEKAIESYFHLFHLLICFATENPEIVRSANTMIQTFLSGRTSKDDCPNLGHLLVAGLISEVDITEPVIKAIIKETVTRNVVWMLKSYPELAYLEPSAVSEYRLYHTFQASKTSYRLLMFLNLFRKTAVGNPRKPLTELRDETFERHGAPPRGSAKGLSDAIKRIHQVDHFPDFLAWMDIKTMPSKAQLNSFIKKCIHESVEKGYSRSAITQGEALTLRQVEEPDVEIAEGVFSSYMDARMLGRLNFFPDKRGKKGGYQGSRMVGNSTGQLESHPGGHHQGGHRGGYRGGQGGHGGRGGRGGHGGRGWGGPH